MVSHKYTLLYPDVPQGPCTVALLPGHDQDIAARVFAKTLKTERCWEWQGGKNRHDYGGIWTSGATLMVHRVSWELHYGAIPAGLVVLHKCDHPPCLRPDHLFLGTRTDNMQDARAKRRLLLGEAHPNARLTTQDVRDICATYQFGVYGVKRLAQAYGVSRPVIQQILAGAAWTHVTEDILPQVLPSQKAAYADDNGHPKLTAQQVKDIWNKYHGAHQSKLSLAKEYPVTRRVIQNILQGKAWRHITQALLSANACYEKEL